MSDQDARERVDRERERARELAEAARERAEEAAERARERADEDRERAEEAAERARQRAEEDRVWAEEQSRQVRDRARRRRAGERKERVLHTRISEPLAEDIRRIAEELRVPVSNIVRNVLEEAFSVVETVTENVGDLLEDVVDEADRARTRVGHHRRRHRRRTRRDYATPVERDTPEFPEVVGWQPLILNREQRCADCSDDLERNERAFAGLTARGLSETYLCQDCMDARR